MSQSDLLDSLNPNQREAVSAPPGPLLVLAGAGSGKTRVLTQRLAWLIQTQRVSPYEILAVTFTNKAAAQMRERAEQLLRFPVKGLWIGTFHGLAHRLLRAHWHEAGLTEQFQILDSDDQHRLIRRTMRSMEVDEAQWQPRFVQWWINGQKDEGLRPADIDPAGDRGETQLIAIYAAYEKACASAGLVDFAELLLRAYELWQQQPHLLDHYRQRFQHLLVDEFQDTNRIQYAWLRQLADGHGNITVVGDDDQSIYSWRGARIENIQSFEQDFPGAISVKLEQNYRSTSNVLRAANGLITHNRGRLGKQLWTDAGDGEPIDLYAAFNDLDEARYVAERIAQLVDEGSVRRDIGVLYRSNAQSRVLEEALIAAGIPYRVYGGLRFFERAEIKDGLAYLRLVNNSDDDAAFERIVNTPTRGIGERSVAAIRNEARANSISMWQAAHKVVNEKLLAARACNAIGGFLALMDSIRSNTEGQDLADKAAIAIRESDLRAHFAKDRSEKGRTRLENLDELITAADQFVSSEDEGSELAQFLAHAALESGDAQADTWEDSVQLMTLHSAKGLEFPVVFLCGLEEDLFPHQRSLDSPEQLEEERRLCYVGITRAMRKLHLSYAESRILHGQRKYCAPSRFISELPADCLQEVRITAGYAAPMFQPPTQAPTDGAFHLGQQVHHAKFGDGVVLALEGQGEHARVNVNFAGAGNKWLVLAYAKLAAI
jgi:DNA helicase-2/ATP-dependent DNA helicase PcrA